MNKWVANQSRPVRAKKAATSKKPGTKGRDANDSASKQVTVVKQTTTVVQFKPRNNRRHTIGKQFTVSYASTKDGIIQSTDSNNNHKATKGEWIEQNIDEVVSSRDYATGSKALSCVASETSSIVHPNATKWSTQVNSSSGIFIEEPIVKYERTQIVSKVNHGFKVEERVSTTQSVRPNKRKSMHMDLVDGVSPVRAKRSRWTISAQ